MKDNKNDELTLTINAKPMIEDLEKIKDLLIEIKSLVDEIFK